MTKDFFNGAHHMDSRIPYHKFLIFMSLLSFLSFVGNTTKPRIVFYLFKIRENLELGIRKRLC